MSTASLSVLVTPMNGRTMTPPSRGFTELDDAAIAAEPGTFVVTVRDEERASLLAHVARRLQATGCTVVRTANASGSLLGEVATQLGLGASLAK
jgi:hypothetical protein